MYIHFHKRGPDEAYNILKDKDKLLSSAIDSLNMAHRLIHAYEQILADPDCDFTYKWFWSVRRDFIVSAKKPDGTSYLNNDLKLPRDHRENDDYMRKLQNIADHYRLQVSEFVPQYTAALVAALPPAYRIV